VEIVECGAGVSNAFRRNIFLSRNDLNAFRRSFNNTNVYSTIFVYDSDNQREANKYGPLYCDFDGEYQQVRDDALKVAAFFKTVMAIPYDEMFFFYSGSKGLHLLIPTSVFNLEPRSDLNQVYRRLMVDIAKTLWGKDNILKHTLDLKIYDIRRLFRLPNSRHGKTGLFKVPLTIDEVRNLTEQQIQYLAMAPRRVITKQGVLNKVATAHLESFYEAPGLQRSLTTNIYLRSLPSCITWILDNPPQEGSRDNTCMLVASALRQTGKEKSAVKEQLFEWGSKCNPPLSGSIISSIVDRSEFYRYGCSTVQGIAPCDEHCRYQKRGGRDRGLYSFI
jgi:hypothetical protein